MALATVAALGVLGAGTALQAYGQYRNMTAEAHMKKYQAQIQENNALLANMEGDLRREQGQVDVYRYRLAVNRLLSKQKVAYAASGLDVSQGTPVEVMAGTAQVGETEAQTIKFNSLLDVWRLRNQAKGFQEEAGLLRDQAKDIRRQIWPTIAGTILGGVSQGLLASRQTPGTVARTKARAK